MHQNTKSRSSKTEMRKPKGYARGGMVVQPRQTSGWGAATKRNKGKTITPSRNA